MLYALIKHLTLTNRRHWTTKGKVIHTQLIQHCEEISTLAGPDHLVQTLKCNKFLNSHITAHLIFLMLLILLTRRVILRSPLSLILLTKSKYLLLRRQLSILANLEHRHSLVINIKIQGLLSLLRRACLRKRGFGLRLLGFGGGSL
jgi:hypothetical protein